MPGPVGVAAEESEQLRFGEKRRRELEACAGAIAAPPPGLRSHAHARAHGVQNDITTGLEQVALVADRTRGEPFVENVSDPPVAPVGLPRKVAVEQAHSRRQAVCHELDDQVVVRGHQAVREHQPLVARGRAAEQVEEEEVVALVDEDGAPVVASCDDVIDLARVGVTERSAHVFDGSAGRRQFCRETHFRRALVAPWTPVAGTGSGDAALLRLDVAAEVHQRRDGLRDELAGLLRVGEGVRPRPDQLARPLRVDLGLHDA